TNPEHPVQRAVKALLEHLTGVPIPDQYRAIDGCSVPTWAIPLSALARGFARLGSGKGMPPERAKAAQRLRAACAAHPWHVAGTGRFCTAVMEHFGARVFVKTGAEGVFCGAIPGAGLGVAIKIDDGAARASEVAMAGGVGAFVARALRPCRRREPRRARPAAAAGAAELERHRGRRDRARAVSALPAHAEIVIV